VHTPDGAFRACVARPAAALAPVIVALQEILGVNADMRVTCDELAGKGYIAVAPDLFWRMEPGLDLNKPQLQSRLHPRCRCSLRLRCCCLGH
jgi:carboxymethylenebutenolidase